MPTTADGFEQRIARLQADLIEQCRRVETMVNAAVEAVFDRDEEKGRWVIDHDQVIDRVDVQLERTTVGLLTDAAREAVHLSPENVREVLTIVKINNEVERVADGAVNIAERVETLRNLPAEPPATFRVMANSVIGIFQDAVACFENADTALAEKVLTGDDTVDEFERTILRDMQGQVARGDCSVDFAFAINLVAGELERMGDHCTNIAEQVIYAKTGKIVRHQSGHWSAPQEPPS